LATIYRDKAETPILLLIASTSGLGFALYLTYIEKFVLAAWCHSVPDVTNFDLQHGSAGCGSHSRIGY